MLLSAVCVFFLGKRSTNKDKHPTQQLNFKAMNEFLQLWLLLHPTETEMHVNHMLNDDVNVSGLAYKWGWKINTVCYINCTHKSIRTIWLSFCLWLLLAFACCVCIFKQVHPAEWDVCMYGQTIFTMYCDAIIIALVLNL